MTSFGNGRHAEAAAAAYLKEQGYRVLDRNWRTRYCEIDIVARKGNVIYFVEVKYRKNSTWGSGLEYITPKKLEQMHFAAEIWVAYKQWRGDCILVAIEVEGPDFKIGQFLTIT